MSAAEKRVLLIARSFPPHIGGATQRSLKFAKFLPRHGWKVTVLTPQAEFCREAFGIEDWTLLDEIPPKVEILRAPSEELAHAPPWPLGVPGLDRLRERFWRLRCGPDRGTFWHRTAYPAALARAAETPFSAIVASAPMFSTLLLGRRLARKLHIPLVADFRDPWCLRDWPPGWRAGPRARRWERQVLRAAARAVLVAPTMLRSYQEAYARLAHRFRLIENGVDLEEAARSESVAISRERFEIVYTGQFMAAHSPETLLRGLALARERSAAFRARACLLLAGAASPISERARQIRERMEALDLAAAIEKRGYLCHAEAVRLQRSASALILIQRVRYGPSSKSYEYLAAGRPVLALTPRGGEAERVLSKGVMTLFADPEDPEGAAGKLLDLFARWERGELFDLPALEVPPEFTRAYQAKQLAGLLDEVLAERAGGDR